MKTVVQSFVLLMLLFVVSSDAASFFTDQGSIQVGGSIGFSTTGEKNQDYRRNEFTFVPMLNFFPLDYFLLGPVFNIKVEGSNGNSTSQFAVGARAGIAYGGSLPIIPFAYGSPQVLIYEHDSGFGFEVAGGIMIPVQNHFSINIGPGFWMQFNDGLWLNSFHTTIGVTGWIF